MIILPVSPPTVLHDLLKYPRLGINFGLWTFFSQTEQKLWRKSSIIFVQFD